MADQWNPADEDAQLWREFYEQRIREHPTEDGDMPTQQPINGNEPQLSSGISEINGREPALRNPKPRYVGIDFAIGHSTTVVTKAVLDDLKILHFISGDLLR